MEATLVLAALTLGFTTGFHCLGMCGPIALSLGLNKKQQVNFHFQNITYQLGRIFTYSILGAILGIIGKSFSLVGFQQYLTIFAGVVLIIMALFSFGSSDVASKVPYLNRFLMQIKIKLGKLLSKSDYSSRFLTGILNGLLPCGMVYVALTASLASGGIWQGAVFMAVFGFGTFPFMFGVVFLGNIVTAAFRTKILKIVPVIMIILGTLFILRGLELGIPYVSPKAEAMQIQQNNAESQTETCH